MDAVQNIKKNHSSYILNEAVQELFSKLDEAIEDVENGRVQTINDAWKEIDAV